VPRQSLRRDLRQLDRARGGLGFHRAEEGPPTGHADELLADADLPAQEVDRADLEAGDLAATEAAPGRQVDDGGVARFYALGERVYLVRRRYDVRSSLDAGELYARARRDADRPVEYWPP
jgi:hypothetical protein